MIYILFYFIRCRPEGLNQSYLLSRRTETTLARLKESNTQRLFALPLLMLLLLKHPRYSGKIKLGSKNMRNLHLLHIGTMLVIHHIEYFKDYIDSMQVQCQIKSN